MKTLFISLELLAPQEEIPNEILRALSLPVVTDWEPKQEFPVLEMKGRQGRVGVGGSSPARLVIFRGWCEKQKAKWKARKKCIVVDVSSQTLKLTEGVKVVMQVK